MPRWDSGELRAVTCLCSQREGPTWGRSLRSQAVAEGCGVRGVWAGATGREKLRTEGTLPCLEGKVDLGVAPAVHAPSCNTTYWLLDSPFRPPPPPPLSEPCPALGHKARTRWPLMSQG